MLESQKIISCLVVRTPGTFVVPGARTLFYFFTRTAV